MKLPNYDQAIVPESKITKYLLSPTHEDGKSKEEFFTSFGFSISEWKTMANSLCLHAALHEVSEIKETTFGTKYIIEGEIKTPDSRNPYIRAVWIIEDSESIPSFVTAHKLRRRRQ
ncbi:DUF6883 domain-containing protein [Pseudanabaena mucicola]|uniref:DUF6883 domain-containing protein n=1 Tax=Pseudanabaena mucicola FACHB-723 TaxID=2692860 RepID=A0ABR8A0F8_9CYAN|nr:DUF6883 domain-containing protein [Pseudanabaena mucicola]MBD2189604.1 hypothetical protein [Pseudanabaena mucicola FACHB-723]